MKRLILFLLVRLRLLALWRHWHRKQITILMLHGVSGEQSSTSWKPLWVRPKIEKIGLVIRQLSEYYTPISLDEAVRILGGSAPAIDYGLVVTFDDGYRNNFSDVLPLLEKMGVPATYFVATGFVGTGRSYWVDRLDYALQHAPDDRRLLRAKGYEFDLRGLDHDELADGYRELRVSVKKNETDDEDMMSVVDDFAESLESGCDLTIKDIIDTDPYVSIATWKELSAACQQGATIGSHSVDHYRLTSIAQSVVDEQINDSKIEIEEKLGADCEFFCYPNGSYDEYILERTRQAGYRAAVTTFHGLNTVGDDLYALNRYPVPLSDDPQKNLLHISGLLESRFVRTMLILAGKR